MSGFDGLLVSQVLVQVPMPVFCCDLSPYSPALQMARQAIEALRAQGLEVVLNPAGKDGPASFKAQFKRADRSGAAVAVVLGADEVASGSASIKPLRGGEQTTVSFDALAAHLVSMIQ